MKQLIIRLKPYSIFIFFVLMLALTFPQNLSKSSESSRNAIITTVGVDKTDENYELTFISFTPTAGKEFVEVYDLISSEGDSLSGALKKAELNLGKVIEFYHTENLVVGKEAQNNIVEILDYFVREKTLAFSSVLVGTESSAKDFLTKLYKQNDNPSAVINELMLYNSKQVYYQKPTIEVFFSGYYSPLKTSYIADLDINPEGEQEQGGDKSQESSKSSRKIIKNTGELRIFKDGKLVYKLSSEDVNGLNWFQASITDRYIKVEKDGQIKMYHMDNKAVDRKVEMKDNQPIFKLNLKIHIDKQEVQEVGKKHIEVKELTNEEQDLIKESVRSEIKQAIDKLAELKAGNQVYKMFYREERIKFKKFLETLENTDEFLSKVIFDVQIDLLDD